jgi:hypothetical protein
MCAGTGGQALAPTAAGGDTVDLPLTRMLFGRLDVEGAAVG